MYAQAHFPSEPLTPGELDQYLSKGWFRMGQSIFTTTYIELNHQIYRVFWLRILLDEFTQNKTFQKLSRLNSKFRLSIQQATVTPEKEELYNTYKSGITFEPCATLESLIFSDSEFNIYNTLEITIHDGEKLIAVGYFDIGENSAAGISCFYDPAYKKYSLGKYLIYQKMLYCKNQHMQYFYLGYFTPGCRAFDYKLDIGKKSIEYLELGSEKWYTMDDWDGVSGSIAETMEKLTTLQHHLNTINIENQLLLNRYFQVNLYKELQGLELFDFIMFVCCFRFNPDVVNPIVVYDIRDQQYHLLHCISLGKPEEQYDHTEDYSAHLLKITEIIYSAKNPERLVEWIHKTFASFDEDQQTI